MKIESKYNIGNRVWVVYEQQGEVSVYDDVINEICVNSEGIYYMLQTACIDRKEEEIILYDKKSELLEKIEGIMKKIHQKESEDKQ